MTEFGEGTVRIDKATTFMIKMARIAQKRWKLTPAAMELVFDRLAHCEDNWSSKGTMKTKSAIHGHEAKLSPPAKATGKGQAAVEAEPAEAA